MHRHRRDAYAGGDRAGAGWPAGDRWWPGRAGGSSRSRGLSRRSLAGWGFAASIVLPASSGGVGRLGLPMGTGHNSGSTSPGVAALDRVEGILRNPEIYKLASLIPQPSREKGGRGRDYPDFMYLVFEALISVYASARQVEVGLSPPEARIGVAGPPPRPSQPQRSPGPPGTPWRACRHRRCFLWFVTINQALADGSLDKVAGGDDNRIRTPTPQ